jgi:hypothetical protein
MPREELEDKIVECEDGFRANVRQEVIGGVEDLRVAVQAVEGQPDKV